MNTPSGPVPHPTPQAFLVGALKGLADLNGWALAPWRRAAHWADRAALALLTLVVATLLCRPADLIPALEGAPIYEGLVVACLAVSMPRLWAQFSPRALRENAVTALVLLLVPAVVLSHLAHGDTYDARLGGAEMAKAAALFLLVVTQATSLPRLRAVLGAIVAGVAGVAALAVLQYHGAFDFPALSAVEQRGLDTDGPAVVVRVCGIGLFNDPNDFCLVLVIASIVCTYWLGQGRCTRWRWALLVPFALFAYTFFLTHSRGGFMAALAGALAFLVARFGWRNALPLLAVLAPVVLAPLWGRQTSVNLDDPEDTFQTRMDLWRGSLDAFRSSPVLGIGQGKLTDLLGLVAHNSYLHAFAELGFVGGVAFAGAFFLVIRGLWRAAPADPAIATLRPYVLAIVVSYGAGLLSLSRCYTVPTQLVLGLGGAYLNIASRAGAHAVPTLDARCVRTVAIVGLVLLAATYLFVRVMSQGAG
jgi:hypothetical protein